LNRVRTLQLDRGAIERSVSPSAKSLCKGDAPTAAPSARHQSLLNMRQSHGGVCKVVLFDDRPLKGAFRRVGMNVLPRKVWSVCRPDATFALHRLIPLAYGVFIVGFLISAALFSAGRPPTLEDGIMTNLLSRMENPQGWLFSAIAAVWCGVLLLPAATLFARGWKSPYRRWAVLGGWFYRIGLIAACVVGVTSPFELPYGQIHVWVAFLAFMSTVVGLAACLGVAAHSHARIALAALAALHIAALVFLAYLFFTPTFFEGRLWLLAVCEWALVALIAAGPVALTTALLRFSHQ